MSALVDSARATMVEQVGSKPTFMIRSPGRVNLIGDHTDYNEGFALPMAIDCSVVLALVPRSDRQVRVWSELTGHWASFSLDSLVREGGWSAYLQGVAHELAESGRELSGWDGVIVSDIPGGAGLSSSAALELAVARAFTAISDEDWDPQEMALLCQRAENRWVGVNCGIMDQLICASGQADRAMLMDCRDLSLRPVPIPQDAVVVVLDTKTRRELSGSAYNERRSTCEKAALELGVRVLRDADLSLLASAEHSMEPVIYRRARHVVNENRITGETVAALEQGSAEAAGLLMQQSHASLRDDFEVSSAALDAMVAAAMAAPGCLGARMTGGGFGGSAVALVREDHLDAFVVRVLDEYLARFGIMGAAIPVRPAPGTALIG